MKSPKWRYVSSVLSPPVSMDDDFTPVVDASGGADVFLSNSAEGDVAFPAAVASSSPIVLEEGVSGGDAAPESEEDDFVLPPPPAATVPAVPREDDPVT